MYSAFVLKILEVRLTRNFGEIHNMFNIDNQGFGHSIHAYMKQYTGYL